MHYWKYCANNWPPAAGKPKTVQRVTFLHVGVAVRFGVSHLLAKAAVCLTLFREDLQTRNWQV